MLATLPVPILSITTEAVRDLQGQDALYGLWTVFTKCKESVQDGRRLENISWRLWYRELIQAQVSCQSPTPESVTPRPKDERFRASCFAAHADEKVSQKRQVLSSGLPSPSDQASPSPLPPPMPAMIPPPTPERPRISPHSAGSAAPLTSFTRGKSTPRVGRLIVDMLPNHLSIPQPKPTSTAAPATVLSTPQTPPTVQPSRSCDHHVPQVQLPISVEAPFPRVVVVNPTPHPTPPTTPILHHDTPCVPQPHSTFLLPPLPPPVLRSNVPSAEVQAQQQSPTPPPQIPKEPSPPHTSTRVADTGSLSRRRDVTPPQARPSAVPKRFSSHAAAGNVVLNGNASNGSAKAKATRSVNGNGNAQSRKTIVVANTSSEEYETTDGEDSEEWASEEMDAEDKAREAEETRLREAALEAQRQRELFAKVPKRSYSNLNRSQSGLLSQLMNPDPGIFPLNHPYRTTRSSADISRQYQQPRQHAPVPQRSSSAYAPPRLSTSKSAAALPLAAQINAISSSKPPAPKRQENEKNGYRPKGPPKEQEMEDDSGDDADDKIQMSQSVAQKLQALMSRRSSQQGTASHLIQPVAMEVPGPGLLSSTTAPIPLGHPYNLPAAAAPMTPRTTRRRMLKTELSESMRRQLLWERQVSSNANPNLVARRATQGLGGLRPLTSTSSDGIKDTAAEAQDKEERRRRAMARNRSWADDYHYSGW